MFVMPDFLLLNAPAANLINKRLARRRRNDNCQRYIRTHKEFHVYALLVFATMECEYGGFASGRLLVSKI
jgi:hypothetical protein